MLSWYAPLYRKKVGVDILDPLRDLSSYKVVIAPNLYLIHPALVENLRSYVRQGGWLIVGPKAGLKDWNNVFYTDIPPCGGLSDLLGTTVQPAPFRFGRVEMPAKHVTLAADAPFAPGLSFGHQGIFDNLEPAQARAIACHEDGKVAVTLNNYGQGMAMYVGCQPEEAFYTRLVEWLIHSGKLEPVLQTEADVEVTMRAGGGHRLIFVLNHHAEPVQIRARTRLSRADIGPGRFRRPGRRRSRRQDTRRPDRRASRFPRLRIRGIDPPRRGEVPFVFFVSLRVLGGSYFLPSSVRRSADRAAKPIDRGWVVPYNGVQRSVARRAPARRRER